jgi:hypothetical protein
MGVESPPGIGASAGTDAPAHDRICLCPLAAEHASCHTSTCISSRLWVWSTRQRHPPRKTGRFTGADFPLQPDGTLRCPAGKPLHLQERQSFADGSLRVVYAASIRHCRPCPLRKPRQWNGNATAKPRQVSVRLASAPGGSRTAAASRDWSRREHRRACMQLVRHQRIEVSLSPPAAQPATADVILSRAQRAHSHLSWEERLARNACPPTAGHVTIKQIAHPNTLCSRARVGDGLTPPFPTTGFLLLGQLRWSAWHLMAFFLAFPLLLPCRRPIPLVLSSLRGSMSSSERLSLLTSGLALQRSRCASPGKRKGYRNGTYTRDLATATGRLEDLKVPQDREDQFHTQTFERYQRYEPHMAQCYVRCRRPQSKEIFLAELHLC